MGKKPFMGRDYLLLKIIGGATKSGVATDRKKEANKTASRGKKMNRADRGSAAQQNTMQLQELKALKETVAKQKVVIEAQAKELKELKANILLTKESIDKIAKGDDLVAAIVKARS